jgi:hypothetical protein
LRTRSAIASPTATRCVGEYEHQHAVALARVGELINLLVAEETPLRRPGSRQPDRRRVGDDPAVSHGRVEHASQHPDDLSDPRRRQTLGDELGHPALDVCRGDSNQRDRTQRGRTRERSSIS